MALTYAVSSVTHFQHNLEYLAAGGQPQKVIVLVHPHILIPASTLHIFTRYFSVISNFDQYHLTRPGSIPRLSQHRNSRPARRRA